eukprot:TRINITY_DN12405_c0_g6_i1.p1 TRINITY_DN12405_c0_g6~~TRINITY_DN12405_c0_g6_i1.p1  ORF type:complete len:835 (-),score=179.19 TRINITY_DN12405_c0_g6_i1:269-2773(-)
MEAVFVLALALTLPAEVAADTVHRWAIRNTVLSPDGYPRTVIAVVDLKEEVVTGPFKTEYGSNTSPYNMRISYKGRDGQLPGPTLTVRQGETVTVEVTNELDDLTSVHWHGLHQLRNNWMDGVAGVTECGITTGETRKYRFNITQGPGTHWYHSHVAAQTADGLQGPIVILPRKGEVDPVKVVTPYAVDQVLMVQDWSHDSSRDLMARYMSRIGSYSQVVPNSKINDTTGEHAALHTEVDNVPMDAKIDRPFLPDYPWPSSQILIGGRGQNKCVLRTFGDCERVRVVGWPHWLNSSNPPYYNGVDKYSRSATTGLLTGTMGQCMPARPPLDGYCVRRPAPAAYQCLRGNATRLRIINSGYSMPLRVWVDRHNMTVVERDGIPVVPNGPHKVLTIAIGQRIDVVIPCTADPHRQYKIFAQVALWEFYPGAQRINFQAHSYALLGYRGFETLEVAEPEWEPDVAWPSAAAGFAASGDYQLYRSHYASWNIGAHDYVPTSIELSLKPLLAADQRAPAANGGRATISSGGDGNWWNNETNVWSMEGLPYEWWTANDGTSYTELTAPLTVPEQPLLQAKMMGRSMHELYGEGNPLPLVKTLEYKPEDPVTYEVVLVNWDGQQHPWHVHGMTLKMVGFGWLNDTKKWSTKAEFKKNFVYDPADFNLPALNQEAEVVMGDTITFPPHSFWVLRIVADNPGAWLIHCHMDAHLVAGMGFILSVEDSSGQYLMPPPPMDYVMCNSRQSTYAAYVNPDPNRHKTATELDAVSDSNVGATGSGPSSANPATLGGIVLVTGAVFMAIGVAVGRFWGRGASQEYTALVGGSETQMTSGTGWYGSQQE